jgi:predicted nucleic acid-binding protein
MSVLIDTSVWVGHFRDCNEALVDLIELDLALTHPMVLVELACGTPLLRVPRRSVILGCYSQPIRRAWAR